MGIVCQAEGMPVTEWLASKVVEYGEDPKIARLGLPKIRDRLKKCEDALKQHRASLSQWDYPVDFTAEKAQLNTFVSQWHEAVSSFKLHVSSLQLVTQKRAADILILQREWRKVRDRLRAFFDAKHVPDCIGMAAANHLKEIGETASSVGIKLGMVLVRKIGSESGLSLQIFLEPFLIHEPQRVELVSTPFRLTRHRRRLGFVAVRLCLLLG